MKKGFLVTASWIGALALALCPTERVEAAILVGLTSSAGSNSLVVFDSANPNTVLANPTVTGLASGDQLIGIDWRPANGQLYGLSSGSRLYVINQSSGVATQVGADGSFTLSGTNFGMDFNPVVDRLRVTSNTGQNLRLNPNDGTLTGTDTSLAYAAGDPNNGQTPQIVGSGYTNNVGGAGSTTLFGIDSNLNILVTQIPPNSGTLNTIGNLGVDVPVGLGFEITPGAEAFVAFTGQSNMAQLHSINLATGALTFIGNIGAANFNLIGLASGVPEPSSFILLGMGAGVLIVGARRRRKTA